MGLKAGDEKELNITFPEDYVPDLAGKAVIFKVKVKEVKEHQAPVVDDEFAKDVSEFETLEEFKKSLGDKLLDSKTKSAQQEYENAVIEQLVGNMEADIPDAMVEVQLDKLMEDFSMRLSNQGMKMEDYLAMMGATPSPCAPLPAPPLSVRWRWTWLSPLWPTPRASPSPTRSWRKS